MNDFIILNTKLKQALEIYQEKQLSVLPSQEELENIHRFSSAFEQKMKKLIRNQKKPYYMMINTIGKRVAIVIIVIFITLMTTVFCVKALRNDVLNFFIEIHKKFSIIFFDNNTPDASITMKIDKVYVPAYIPDGFALTSKTDSGIIVRYEYSDSEDNQLFFEQMILLSKIAIDTENRKSEEVDVNGNLGICFFEKEYNNLIWDDGTYGYHLISTLNIDVMIKVAESIIPRN